MKVSRECSTQFSKHKSVWRGYEAVKEVAYSEIQNVEYSGNFFKVVSVPLKIGTGTKAENRQ